jgi:uncharacterized FlaG/YvyC family protein
MTMDNPISRVGSTTAISAAAEADASPAQTPAAAKGSTEAVVQSSNSESKSRHVTELAQLLGGRDSSEDRLKVSVDEKAGVIVRIVDARGEVVRQIPPDELIALSKRMGEMIGLLFDRKA